MIAEIDALITESHRLIAACQTERLALAAAYAPLRRTVIPLEQPPAGWQAGRDEAEHVCGCTIRRFYTEKH